MKPLGQLILNTLTGGILGEERCALEERENLEWKGKKIADLVVFLRVSNPLRLLIVPVLGKSHLSSWHRARPLQPPRSPALHFQVVLAM